MSIAGLSKAQLKSSSQVTKGHKKKTKGHKGSQRIIKHNSSHQSSRSEKLYTKTLVLLKEFLKLRVVSFSFNLFS